MPARGNNRWATSQEGCRLRRYRHRGMGDARLPDWQLPVPDDLRRSAAGDQCLIRSSGLCTRNTSNGFEIPSGRMLRKFVSGVLASLRGSMYRNIRLAFSLATALLETRRVSARQGWAGEKSGLFEHPEVILSSSQIRKIPEHGFGINRGFPQPARVSGSLAKWRHVHGRVFMRWAMAFNSRCVEPEKSVLWSSIGATSHCRSRSYRMAGDIVDPQRTRGS